MRPLHVNPHGTATPAGDRAAIAHGTATGGDA